ncbi:MAG: hypothetical protein HN778_10365 [Prolixibacteraceae bacterium]|jgi:hypothetical protein|nr:hypothetical protein [Prolixibacteraceae bacterium]MBT6004182.1 hypothetical protein [Prolixibacteraceae bacterium]MBT6765258.1 hypothetical protein [Prolixibacteraceae bacterium]MBT6999396.1 hypothetical protein [Prolixibacteraceae bacterium]MBT7395226.1 hypothetical protein [Prolixibacteraceae bacterium]
MEELITLKQKQEWREIYKQKRYLANLSIISLKIRLEEILSNLLNFSKNGEPFFDQTIKMKGLIERYIHVDEEMNQREIYESSIKNPGKYLNKYTNVENAIKAWDNRKLTEGKHLVKFGKKEHLCQMKENGNIRINPASFYNDSSLNKAVQDDELSQTTMLPKGTKIKRQNSNSEFEEIKGVQNLSMTNKYTTNFYVYCMSTIYQHRLFDDFNANACLLIYNEKIFLDKFLRILKNYYSEWQLKSENIKYYDPFFPKPPLDIPFNKHFRYWYQSEYRISFKPKNPADNLDYIDLEIGSLNNCSELILL